MLSVVRSMLLTSLLVLITSSAFSAQPNTALIQDDTEYCQKKIDSGNKLVTFDRTYRITSPLLIPSNITIKFEKNCKFIFDLPSSVSWDDNKTGRFPGASCFVNRAGLKEYVNRAVSGKLMDHYKLLKPVDHDIHFIGHAEFTTTTLDEKNHRGAWTAISLLYVENLSVESIETNILNGLYLFECANGNIEKLKGQYIRNYGIVGGVALVGHICDNIRFKNIYGYKNHCTFVIDGAAATNIIVDYLHAVDAKGPADKPVSLRPVEITGAKNIEIKFMHLEGGGLYQSLFIGELASNVYINGIITDSYKESIRFQNASNCTIDIKIVNPWVSNDPGYDVDESGVLSKTVKTHFRPVVFFFKSQRKEPVYENKVKVKLTQGSGKSNKLMLQAATNKSDVVKIKNNVVTTVD